jgi:hypothetical protein
MVLHTPVTYYRLASVLVSIRNLPPRARDLFERDTAPFLSRESQASRSPEAADVVVQTHPRDDPPPVPAAAEPIVLHNRDTPLSGWAWHDGPDQVIYNPHHPAVYRINGRHIAIGYLESPFNAFIGLRLLLLPLLYRLSDQGTTVTLHASAAAGPAGGLLFCGAKGAGKTSIALTLAMTSGYGFIANDYSLLSPGPASASILGAPEPIRVADGTYQAMSRQLRWADSTDVFLGKKYLHLRLARQHMELTPRAPLRAVYFPRLSGSGDLAIRPVPGREAVSRLLEQAMEVTRYQTPMIVPAGPGPGRGDLRSRLSGLLTGIPSYELTVPQAWVGTAQIAAALERECASHPGPAGLGPRGITGPCARRRQPGHEGPPPRHRR